jgi:hypothetical protein
MLDLANAWVFDDPAFLGWDAELDPPFCASFARALWEVTEPQLRFPRAILTTACDRAAQIHATIQPFPLAAATHQALRARYAILRAGLKRHAGDIRLADLEHIAKVWYDSNEEPD